MTIPSTHRCFGDLNTVFPLGDDGLRHTPPSCLRCEGKTDCLRTAMQGPDAMSVKEEMLERAYRGGLIGRFKRWSQKKAIHRMKNIR